VYFILQNKGLTMRRALIAFLLASVSTPALALDACKITPDDPQMRVCAYKPSQRYLVQGAIGNPVNLSFGPQERIKRLEWAYGGTDEKGNPIPAWHGPQLKSAGHPDGMEASAYQNNLPIWPMDTGESRVLVITSTPSGEERPYQFELWARQPEKDCAAHPTGVGCPGDDGTITGLQFTYPAEVSAAQAQAWKQQQAEKAAKTAQDRLKVDPFYGTRNWQYEAHGKPEYKSLAPTQISDNGWLTAMQWPGNIRPPSIYLGQCQNDGKGLIAPTTMREDGLVVVHTTSEWFCLRGGGEAVLALHNAAFNPERADPRTGTTSTDVVRQVISAKSSSK
jgi:type IV secretory pathway VirB9-like protein